MLRAAQASKELTSLTLHRINGMTSAFAPALASLTSLQELDVGFRSSSQWQSGFHGRYRQFWEAMCKLPLTSLTAKTMALNSQGLLQLPVSLQKLTLCTVTNAPLSGAGFAVALVTATHTLLVQSLATLAGRNPSRLVRSVASRVPLQLSASLHATLRFVL